MFSKKFYSKLRILYFYKRYTIWSTISSVKIFYISGGATAHVQAIVKGKALLPCDLTPPAPNDSVVLVVWYKDEHTPIYRYVSLNFSFNLFVAFSLCDKARIIYRNTKNPRLAYLYERLLPELGFPPSRFRPVTRLARFNQRRFPKGRISLTTSTLFFYPHNFL